ncbi:ATP-binding cassette domain-containing protein [Frigoribacterium sp. Leaf263]|uniref:ATP-binding cassette domain-containing protein n=1 Tax=Frigoribacterium sp. Leaf263 TaxID=1736313 RepID=UPI000AC29565|nr:ABC transporter ATP-binding protein [Frigoribacterium sp. Leaf263]
MAATTDDEQGAERAEQTEVDGGRPDSGTGTDMQGDESGDGDVAATPDESAAGTPTPKPRPSARAPRRPSATRSAADRSAAAKKAAATRAANARARASEVAAAAVAQERAERERAEQQVAGQQVAEQQVAEQETAEQPAAETEADVASGSVRDDDAPAPVAEEPIDAATDDDADIEPAVVADADAGPSVVVEADADPSDDADPAVDAADADATDPAAPDSGGSALDVGDRPDDDLPDDGGHDAEPSADAVETVVEDPTRASSDPDLPPVVLAISGLVKRYGATTAVDGIDLEVRAGSFYGIVGPNGAGKTTTLSIVTGLLRPDEGSVSVLGSDVWTDPAAAKRALGVLPDRLRLFDRLTGAQLLYYSATLRGLDGATARKRTSDLATAFGLQDALGRLVSDYSVGMTKKIAIAAAIIHSPRVLVLDEPFESVDPVSAQTVTDVLQRYVAGGGTVLLSSHSMDLVERICDSVAVIVDGHVLASGTVDEVRAGRSLEQTFVELAGGRAVTEGMEWLQSFSD